MKIVIEFDLTNEDDKADFEDFQMSSKRRRALDEFFNITRSKLKYDDTVTGQTAAVLEELRQAVAQELNDE